MSEEKKIPKTMLPFHMGNAQELVNAYVACGRYVEALRLLRCMKEKAFLDVETFENRSFIDVAGCLFITYLTEEFIPEIDRQSEEIRAKLRAGI